jgi:aryl-alcohol dehydrogenase-like predicted oxidoreductase
MHLRQLGSTELELSVIGLGTWAMGGAGWQFSWGNQDERDSIKTIHTALDLGINWIDSAPVYGHGCAEEVIGKALKGMHEKPFIATKCSRILNDKGEIISSLKRESILKEAENSLRRLQVEVIDLYQIHWPKPKDDLLEGWEAIVSLIKQGKVRYGGVSNFNINQMEKIWTIYPIASLQPPYSMLKSDIENEVIPYCGQRRIGIICYSPMQKGLLSGKMSKERVTNLDKDDHRRKDPMFSEPQLGINLDFVEKLKPIADQYDCSVAQLSIAWTLRHPEITAAIVGARKPQQIRETIKAADLKIDHHDLEKIDQLLREHQQNLARV